MRKAKYAPIPREEPPDDELIAEPRASSDAPITVRPPPRPLVSSGGGLVSGGAVVPSAASYQNLRNSCRAAAVGEPEVDAELAIEAEVLRLAMDRGRGKAPR